MGAFGRKLAVLTSLLALSGCKPAVRQPAAPVPAAEANALSLAEYMTHVIAFSADNVWKWQGWSNGPEGERSLFPKDGEQWEQAESAALTLAEVAKGLKAPGRRIDAAGWDKSVDGLAAAARRLAKTAEAHDEDAFFKAGSSLDKACITCHRTFAPQLEPQLANLE
jgi:hypothetical protein